MTTQTKPAKKIVPYKVVNVGTIINKTDDKDKGKNSQALILQKNVEATNSIGNTLNGLLGVVGEFVKAQRDAFAQEKANYAQMQSRKTSVKSIGGPDSNKSKGSGVLGYIATAAIGFWQALGNMFGDLFRLFVLLPVMKWLSDESNREKLIKAIETVSNVMKNIFNFLKDNVLDGLEGLAAMMDGDKSWDKRVGGFLKFMLNAAGVFILFRWITNPFKIIKDFVGVFKMFRSFLRMSIRMVRSRAGKLGIALTALGLAAAEYMTPDDFALKPSAIAATVADAAGFEGDDRSNLSKALSELPDDPPPKAEPEATGSEPQREKGGLVPFMMGGGLITGPDSGYPVSLTGRGIDFIGHGTELVLPRESGGFVVPLDNKATRRDPSLTNRRFADATRLGFGRESGGKIPEFESGGFFQNAWKGVTGMFKRPQQSTASEKTKAGPAAVEPSNPYSNLPAVQAVGRMLLGKGFTVAEHPNFRKNAHTGTGPNPSGYEPGGGAPVGGHSGNSLHYKGLAIDVTDWRPGDWKGRTGQLAADLFRNRNKLKLSQIIYDGWGSWFHPEANYTPGPYGGHDTHLHLGFLAGKADADASVNGAGGGTTPGATGTTPGQTGGQQTAGGLSSPSRPPWVPSAITEPPVDMDALTASMSSSISASSFSNHGIIQETASVRAARESAKANAAGEVRAQLQSAQQASNAAAKKAEALSAANTGGGQKVHVPLNSGGGGKNSSHVYIGYYAPKFGLFAGRN